MPHSAIGPREDTKPKLTITASTSSYRSFPSFSHALSVTCSMRCSPCSAVISIGVITLTLEFIRFSTLCSCARNLSLTMNKRDALCDRLQHKRPVYSGIAAAANQDFLTFKPAKIADKIMQVCSSRMRQLLEARVDAARMRQRQL